ncbi:hypothetical protein K470DRAFT_260770 [Piedraia hortae CBS 480.64]|uniref:DNA recombination and repair protein Rad51-like C-terminal domain-containing protein n=1 Tax=Piedraia hortae CBS 480.64 TaxID=1314780 RepID=A0A6A7BQT8_9PEZI|nr:hypothetical protein K470DRAFT_260770 [Piedraia hortae CBS 480.64]
MSGATTGRLLLEQTRSNTYSLLDLVRPLQPGRGASIEVLSPASTGHGKTFLLYHLIALLITGQHLPTFTGTIFPTSAPDKTIIVITDHTFNVLTLAAHISSADRVRCLKHLHIFTPPPSDHAALLATIESIKGYILDTSRHVSGDRNLALIALDVSATSNVGPIVLARLLKISKDLGAVALWTRREYRDEAEDSLPQPTLRVWIRREGRAKLPSAISVADAKALGARGEFFKVENRTWRGVCVIKDGVWTTLEGPKN